MWGPVLQPKGFHEGPAAPAVVFGYCTGREHCFQELVGPVQATYKLQTTTSQLEAAGWFFNFYSLFDL